MSLSATTSETETMTDPVRKSSKKSVWLITPGVIWMTLFLVAPMLMMVYVSFWTQTTFAITPDLTTKSWVTFFTSETYLNSLWTTIRIWLIVLVATIVVGYPAALFVGLLALAAAHLLLPLDLFTQLDGETARLLLFELRAPRTVLAIAYGAALGVTGAALQAVFANPLASPDITGAASGGAFGAVATAHFALLTGPFAMALGGMVGAGAALAALFAIAGRGADPTRLLLAGLAIALAAGAATSLLLALAPSPFAFYDQWRWLMGSLVDRGWPEVAMAAVPGGLVLAVLLAWSKRFDLLALGEDVAAAYGIRPRQLATRTIALSAVAIGACVAACGAIGFVGLIAPIAARALVRGHPGRALGPAAIIGATLLLGADLLVRAAPAGRPIPIGVVTAIVGTPLFILLLMRLRGRSFA